MPSRPPPIAKLHAMPGRIATTERIARSAQTAQMSRRKTSPTAASTDVTPALRTERNAPGVICWTAARTGREQTMQTTGPPESSVESPIALAQTASVRT